jgi:hypothetical protein
VTRWRLALQPTEERDMKKNEKHVEKVVVKGSNKESPAVLPCKPFFGANSRPNPALEEQLGVADHEARRTAPAPVPGA